MSYARCEKRELSPLEVGGYVGHDEKFENLIQIRGRNMSVSARST